MSAPDREAFVAHVTTLFTERGATAYLGEPVTVAEHMLQCAALAQAEGAPDPLIVAALLHDIGHLCGDGEYTPEDAFDRGHEASGAALLAHHLPPEVVEPIRLHVAAKRYLCTTDPTYRARLTPASQHSLDLQGGLMDQAEVAAFERTPFARDGIRVRMWDDGAKDRRTVAPPLSAFLPLLRATLDTA